MELSCGHGQSINIVRAVWGRYSVAVCRSSSSSSSQTSSCGDTTLSRRILSSLCQGQQHCQVSVNTDTFGDPCPETTEFLEVQYQCVHTNKKQENQMKRKPKFSDTNIALLWNNNNNVEKQEETILEKLIQTEAAPLRIPITEPTTSDEDDQELLLTTVSQQRISEHEEKIVYGSAILCLLLLPVIISLTVILIRSRHSSKQKIPSVDNYPCLLEQSYHARLMFCRHNSSNLNLTRQFSSEPALLKHCLLESSIRKL